MEDDKMREILEGLNIPSEKVDEIIIAMKEYVTRPINETEDNGDAILETLQKKYEEETDWKKKASLAAQIISNRYK
jgi:hypothetical protein